MKKKLLYLVFPMIALILEILPYGAALNFANPGGKPWRHTYSYFSLTPFGYANFAPLLTAIMTCVILVLLVMNLFAEKPRILKVTKIMACIAAVLSLCPLLYGIDYFSIVGALISISLVMEYVFLYNTTKKSIFF